MPAAPSDSFHKPCLPLVWVGQRVLCAGRVLAPGGGEWWVSGWYIHRVGKTSNVIEDVGAWAASQASGNGAGSFRDMCGSVCG